MNRRGFLASLFGLPVVGPDIVKELGKPKPYYSFVSPPSQFFLIDHSSDAAWTISPRIARLEILDASSPNLRICQIP